VDQDQRPGRTARPATYNYLARMAPVALVVSIGLMVARGLAGGSGELKVPPVTSPWPPWFIQLNLSPAVSPLFSWLAVLSGGFGLAAGLVAVRQGWRPSPRRLIAGSAIAVVMLTVVPPLGTGDPFFYAAYGRIAALGHNPYVTNPAQILPASDPVREMLSQYPEDGDPASRYGLLATLTEAAASKLAGDSPGRTVFWLKVWNALAFLVIALLLDRLVASDAVRRVRVHLLWSVNPLMLFLLMADGHNDVLAAALGVGAILALRKVDPRGAFLAGCALVLAVAVKAFYAVYGAGLVWAARRSPRSLACLALGIAGVLIPSFLLLGRTGMSATTLGIVSGQPPNLLWHEIVGLLGWQEAVVRVNILALIACAMLAALLLWRLPPGEADLPAGRVALAVALALLVASPYQEAYYYAMVFPLLAIFPPSRLDWIAIAYTASLSIVSVGFFYPPSHASALNVMERIFYDVSVMPALIVITAVFLWLCVTGDWRPAKGRHTGRKTDVLVGLSSQ
jgi:hypothetical protein